MREERERKEQRCLEEKHERERQGLTWRLAESEERRREIEEQLQEAQEQVEALLRGSGGMETGGLREEVHRLQQAVRGADGYGGNDAREREEVGGGTRPAYLPLSGTPQSDCGG